MVSTVAGVCCCVAVRDGSDVSASRGITRRITRVIVCVVDLVVLSTALGTCVPVRGAIACKCCCVFVRRTRSRVSAGVTLCVTYAVEYVYSLALFKTAGSTSVPVVVCVGGGGLPRRQMQRAGCRYHV